MQRLFHSRRFTVPAVFLFAATLGGMAVARDYDPTWIGRDWILGDCYPAAPNKAGEFLGVKAGGPTRAGHYFLPAFTVNEQVRGLPDKGPVLRPGRAYEWSLVYDPAANGGQGSITATLGDESVTLHFRQGQRVKAQAARLDRFGLFSIAPGGQIVKLYLDDLEYTAASRL